MEMKEEQYTPAPSEPNNGGLPAVAGKFGGPRTPAGKRRSKYNATKHAIFSSVVVLNTESRRAYTLFLEELEESFHPVGKAEELLVEKLAFLAWRQRRLLSVERVEIDRLQEAILDNRMEELLGVKQLGTQGKNMGLFPYRALLLPELNAEALDKSVRLLGELRDKTKAEGLDVNLIRSSLMQIYNVWSPMSFLLRLVHFDVITISAGTKIDMTCGDGETFKKNLLKGIEDEITLLLSYKQAIELYQAKLKKREKQRHSILDDPALDRLMRYEAHLDRAFDRTLGQLERLQRMRLGHPVPPPLKVDVSKN